MTKSKIIRGLVSSFCHELVELPSQNSNGFADTLIIIDNSECQIYSSLKLHAVKRIAKRK